MNVRAAIFWSLLTFAVLTTIGAGFAWFMATMEAQDRGVMDCPHKGADCGG